MNQGEIIIYQDLNDTDFQLEVRIEDETVWLTQAQMAELFQTTRNNITLHISNIFKEKELIVDSVSMESLLTAANCRTYQFSQNLRQLHLMGKATKLNTTIWT